MGTLLLNQRASVRGVLRIRSGDPRAPLGSAAANQRRRMRISQVRRRPKLCVP